MKHLLLTLVLGALASASTAQTTPVTAEAAWARATVQGQRASGAFMRLTAREPLTLTGAASPVSGVAELHEMKLDGDVMRMRAVPTLELKPGQTVELKPGGHHLMLMDLKAPLAADTKIPVTLSFRNAKGETVRLDLSVPVRAAAPSAAHHKH